MIQVIQQIKTKGRRFKFVTAHLLAGLRKSRQIQNRDQPAIIMTSTFMLHDNIIFLTNNKNRRRSMQRMHAGHDVYVEALLKA